MNCHVLLLQNGNDEIHLLSPFSRDEISKTKSRSEFYFGHLIEPVIGVVPGNVSYNTEFLVHVHSLVRDMMVSDNQVIARAAEQPNGFVFIIDRRSPASMLKSEEKVDKEDIIGVFLCNEGRTSPEKYRPNPDYRLVTEKGVAVFPEVVEVEIRKLLES